MTRIDRLLQLRARLLIPTQTREQKTVSPVRQVIPSPYCSHKFGFRF